MKLKNTIWITIIAFLASCSGFQTFDETTAIKIQIDQKEQAVMGADSWEGPLDCSSHAYLNKTPGGLLFTIEVFDDSIKTGEPQSYMNDGVELYFDFRPPRLRLKDSYEKGVFQAIILPEPGKKQIAPIEWYPKSYKNSIPGTLAYTELRDSGYVLQVSIPYSGLKRNHFWPRNNFYLDVAINDADTGSRESQMMWRGKSNNWNKPHNFEKVQFPVKEDVKAKQSNFLIFLTDQQTMNAMSAYGNPYLNTPNMDALARFGIRFTKSYSSAPVSSPSRSSILTGLMPHTTGVNYNNESIDSSINNMGEYFREAGYTTYWAGKWHLPDAYPQSGTQEVPGFKLIPFSDDQEISNLGMLTDGLVTESVIKTLKGRKKEPFLMVVSLQNPHDIINFPVDRNIFPSIINPKATPPLPFNFRISGSEPDFVVDLRKRESYENSITLTQTFSEEDWKNYLHRYYRLVEKVDEQIGKIIATIEKQGMDENTIIIFTSDHGDGATSHKWASAFSFYEESAKVPLIITKFNHDFKTRVNSTHLVSGIDILPTLMDFAEITVPEGIQGKSIKPIIDKPDTLIREYLVSELAIDPADTGKTGRMITDGQYKYTVFSYGRNREQLFNLITDSGEMRNLAGNPEFLSIKSKMKKALKDWINETNDPFIINP